MSRLPQVWGATPAEAARPYPADELLPAGSLLLTRAVDVAAPPAVTWRWLCQIAVAPYSYDLLDNLGRRSPRELTPGAERLEVGQRIGVVFRLTSYDEGRSWTGLTSSRLLGPVAVTYAAEPTASGSRIVARLAVARAGRGGALRAWLLAWGDLPMMRKQLLTLAHRAEVCAREQSG